MKTEKEELTSPHLKSLEKDLAKIEKAEGYLKTEMKKLGENKGGVRIKIRKEKEILRLKKQIESVRKN